ncbi:MAG: response regulator [Bacteriovoracaceae bacterium]|nr:response regulator [Bacteriovoracaceae bacterium]
MATNRILVVEDNPDLRMLTKLALTKKGFVVTCAENGQVALESIEKDGMPDLILLDMKMPIMDGWEFSKQFKEKHDHAAPIVVMTAAQDSRGRAMEIGADSFLGKPFELDQLFDCVKNMLH